MGATPDACRTPHLSMSDARFDFLEGTAGNDFVCKPEAERFGKPPRGPSKRPSKASEADQAAHTLCFLRRTGSVSDNVRTSPKDVDMMCLEDMVRLSFCVIGFDLNTLLLWQWCRMIFSRKNLQSSLYLYPEGSKAALLSLSSAWQGQLRVNSGSV